VKPVKEKPIRLGGRRVRELLIDVLTGWEQTNCDECRARAMAMRDGEVL